MTGRGRKKRRQALDFPPTDLRAGLERRQPGVMTDRIGREELLALLAQGTPDRMLDAAGELDARDAADLRELRETLAAVALGAAAKRPPAELRARILARKARPRRPVRPVFAVLDMLNDHLTPGRAVEVPRARAIVPALKARLVSARQSKIPVIYLCDEHQDDDPDLSNGTWPIHNVAGTQGAGIWPELAAQPGDHIVKKSTYSAFTGSSFAALLDELGADEIILTGCTTEVGIAATATDALQRGFVVTVPADSQAGSTEITEKLTLLSLSTMPPYDPRYLRAAARAADVG
jgi:nicotinamidase-related amidase